MLDLNLLRNDIEGVAANLLGKKIVVDSEHFQKLEAERKHIQVKMEKLQAKRNTMSKKIGVLKSQGQDATCILQEVAAIGDELKLAESEFSLLSEQLTSFLATLPNLLHISVPHGNDESANKEVRRVGVIPQFPFPVRDHVELGYNLSKGLDLEVAAKISGSRFVILKHKIAKLHRALSQFMLDTHIEEHGYTEVYVPYLVHKDAVFATGQLPKFEEDLFKTHRGEEAMYLIPTSEVSLTNMVANTIVPLDELPLKYVAHSPCFRSEAGSYGRDTRGVIRMHQFDKVEMVQIVAMDKSYEALEEITSHAENILKKLKLPYRVILLCSGDTGFCAAKTYDLEVWIPSQNAYREISSCSNATDFQARRMLARYKNSQGKNELLHTLNGSGLAVGRTLVAVLENYQNIDGSITVPEILRPYMGCDVIS